MNYKQIFDEANRVAEQFTYEQLGTDVMIFPCGFAWVYLKNGIKGKRNPLGKELEKQGLLKYDDYKKHYYVWIGGYNQSMLHKKAHAKYMAITLTERLGVKFDSGSRID